MDVSNLAINDQFYSTIKTILINARQKVYRSINFTMVTTYWNIGRIIVEEEQRGKDKAGYGVYLLKYLSEKLTQDFGKGFSRKNLENIRLFYLTYKNQQVTISQTLSTKLGKNRSIGQTVSGQLGLDKSISETLSRKLKENPFKLSWSHYVFLIRLDEAERKFYEIEAASQGWSVRELERR